MNVYMRSFLHRNIKIIKEKMFRHLAINVIQSILHYSILKREKFINKNIDFIQNIEQYYVTTFVTVC